jgi:hypothetical protein
MRSEFEEYYSTKYPNDDCTWIRNGNYSGWLKQQHWEQWQHQQSKVDELKSTIEKQKKLSLKAIENAKAGSSLELQLAQKLHAESSPDSLESERAMNAQLTNENLLLESKVDELQKRVDAAQKLIDDWNFGGVHIFDLLDELEQVLKGGSDE